jgi:DUF438 domain-containing protein
MEKRVFFSISPLKVMTAHHLLKQAGIVSHSVNKMDSIHANVFGHIEIHIYEEDEERAREILTDAEILGSHE